MSSMFRRYKTVLASREFIITAIAGLFILVSFLLRIGGAQFWMHTSFAVAATAVGGLPIISSAIGGLIKRQVNVDELVAIAIVASTIYGEYLSAAFVAFMMLFGKVLEDFTAERAKTALADLGKLTPSTACVRRGGIEILVPIGDLVTGDIVIAKSGERIAVDGVVVSGQASVNQAPITGESMPVAKAKAAKSTPAR